MMLLCIVLNALAISNCDALPANPDDGGPVGLTSKTLITLIMVATLLSIISFLAVIAYWNTAVCIACRGCPTSGRSTNTANHGAIAYSCPGDCKRAGPWISGNSKISAATASPSSRGRVSPSARAIGQFASGPVRVTRAIPNQASRSKLSAPVVGARPTKPLN